MLCPYKDKLGVPGQGFHRHYFGVAILDIVGSILLSEVIVYLFHTPRWITLFSVLLTGVVMHRLFCVRTTVDKYLFP
jgi:hypothetical protein